MSFGTQGNQTFGGISRDLHVKGWGPKSSVRPSKRRETKFFGGISRDFGRDIPGLPEEFEKNNFVFNFWPLLRDGRNRGPRWQIPQNRVEIGNAVQVSILSIMRGPLALGTSPPQGPYRGLPGPLGPKCRESLENVSRDLGPRDPKKSQKSLGKVRQVCGECPESVFGVLQDFLETFWGPGARGPGRHFREFFGQTEKNVPVHRVSFWKGV